MEKSQNIVLKILLICLCAVLLGSAVFLYAGKQLNGYYSVDPNDAFYSSMTVKEVVPLDSGEFLVFGTFLKDDSILGELAVFVKAYGKDGSFRDAVLMDIPENCRYGEVLSDGETAVLTFYPESSEEGGAYGYQITPELTVRYGGRFEPSGTETGAEKFGADFFYMDGTPVFFSVGDGHLISFRGFDGVFSYSRELSEDFHVVGASCAGENLYLFGTRDSGSGEVPFLYAMDRFGQQLFSVTMMENSVSVIRDVVLGADGKTYLLGELFSPETYAGLAFPDGSYTGDYSEYLNLGKAALNTRKGDSPVYISSDYLKNPWPSFYLAEIGIKGEISEAVLPLSDDGISGISQAYLLKSSGKAAGGDKGKIPLMTLVSKTAVTKNDPQYCMGIHTLYNDMTCSDSAQIFINSWESCFCGTDGQGRVFLYSGTRTREGQSRWSFSFYQKTSDLASKRLNLDVDVKILGFFGKFADRRILAYVMVFLLLYVTARVAGNETLTVLAKLRRRK